MEVVVIQISASGGQTPREKPAGGNRRTSKHLNDWLEKTLDKAQRRDRKIYSGSGKLDGSYTDYYEQVEQKARQSLERLRSAASTPVVIPIVAVDLATPTIDKIRGSANMIGFAYPAGSGAPSSSAGDATGQFLQKIGDALLSTGVERIVDWGIGKFFPSKKISSAAEHLGNASRGLTQQAGIPTIARGVASTVSPAPDVTFPKGSSKILLPESVEIRMAREARAWSAKSGPVPSGFFDLSIPDAVQSRIADEAKSIADKVRSDTAIAGAMDKAANGAAIKGASSFTKLLTGGGMVMTGVGVASAIGDFTAAARSIDSKSRRDLNAGGATKLGMTALGSVLGAIVGSIVPGVGTAAGAWIGGGLGGSGATFFGSEVGKMLSDWTDGTTAMRNVSTALVEANAEFREMASYTSITQDLIGHWNTLKEEIDGGALSAQEMAKKQNELLGVTEKLGELYPGLLTNFSAGTAELEGQVKLIEIISEGNWQEAQLAQLQTLHDFYTTKPSIEKKLSSAQQEEDKFQRGLEVFMGSPGDEEGGFIEKMQEIVKSRDQLNDDYESGAIEPFEYNQGLKDLSEKAFSFETNANTALSGLGFDPLVNYFSGNLETDLKALMNLSPEKILEDYLPYAKGLSQGQISAQERVDENTNALELGYAAERNYIASKYGVTEDEILGNYWKDDESKQKVHDYISEVRQAEENYPLLDPDKRLDMDDIAQRIYAAAPEEEIAKMTGSGPKVIWNDALESRIFNLGYNDNLIQAQQKKDALFETLGSLDENDLQNPEVIKDIQSQLQGMGYSFDNYGVDGKMGKETQGNIEQFIDDYNTEQREALQEELIDKVLADKTIPLEDIQTMEASGRLPEGFSEEHGRQFGTSTKPLTNAGEEEPVTEEPVKPGSFEARLAYEEALAEQALQYTPFHLSEYPMPGIGLGGYSPSGALPPLPGQGVDAELPGFESGPSNLFEWAGGLFGKPQADAGALGDSFVETDGKVDAFNGSIVSATSAVGTFANKCITTTPGGSGGKGGEGGEGGKTTGDATPEANGDILTSPKFILAGEAGPEAIIPLSPQRRERGMALWLEAGRRMGVRQYADGGLIGATAAGAAPSGGGIQINLGGMNFSLEGGQGGEGLISALREQMPAIANDVAETIASALEQTYSNMPLSFGR